METKDTDSVTLNLILCINIWRTAVLLVKNAARFLCNNTFRKYWIQYV